MKNLLLLFYFILKQDTEKQKGEKFSEICGLLILGDVFIFLCPLPTLFNVCHLRDSRGAAPVCLLARSPQIPPSAPACHSCYSTSWDGWSEGRREI